MKKHEFKNKQHPSLPSASRGKSAVSIKRQVCRQYQEASDATRSRAQWHKNKNKIESEIPDKTEADDLRKTEAVSNLRLSNTLTQNKGCEKQVRRVPVNLTRL